MKRNFQRFNEAFYQNFNSDTLKIYGVDESTYIRNHHGHLRNDISKLLDSNNILSYQHAIDSLQELRKKMPDMSKFTKEQLYSMVKPKWVQTNQQNIEFQQYLDSQQIEWLEALKPSEEETITPPPSSATPATPVTPEFNS